MALQGFKFTLSYLQDKSYNDFTISFSQMYLSHTRPAGQPVSQSSCILPFPQDLEKLPAFKENPGIIC